MQWALLLDGNELLVRKNIYPTHHEHYGDACALVFNLLLQPNAKPHKVSGQIPKNHRALACHAACTFMEISLKQSRRIVQRARVHPLRVQLPYVDAFVVTCDNSQLQKRLAAGAH